MKTYLIKLSGIENQDIVSQDTFMKQFYQQTQSSILVKFRVLSAQLKSMGNCSLILPK